MVVYDEYKTSVFVVVDDEHRKSKVCLWWSMMNIEHVRCVYGGP